MERKIGEITHFFAGPSAAVLKLTSRLKLGDEVHILGATTDFNEKVTSMQIDHREVDSAWPGDDVAILVKDRVREGDEVFVIEEEVPAQPSWISSTPTLAPKATPAPAPKPAAQPKPVTKAKPKAKPKAKAKTKAKAKPKPKAKAKKKAKPKAKAKAKAKSKAKPKKKKK